MSLLSALQETNTDLLKAATNTDTEQEKYLTASEQSYANDINKELNGSEAPMISTQGQWDSASKVESLQLASEDAQAELDSNIKAIAEGNADISTVQDSAKRIAVETNMAQTEGIPGAMSISAARQRLVKADEQEPSLTAMPEEFRKQQNNLIAKGAILDDAIIMAQANADKAGLWSKVKYGFNQVFPLPYVAGGIEARTLDKNLKAIGIDNSRWNAVDNKRYFINLMAKFYNDPEVNPLQFSAILKYCMDQMYTAGVNPSAVSELYDSLKDFSPEAESFYLAADVASLATIPAKTITGAVKGTGVAGKSIEAFKGAIRGVGDQVPVIGDVLAKVSSDSIDLVAKSAVNVSDKIGRIKRTGNLTGAAEELIKDMGKPSVKSSKSFIKSFYEHGLPSMAKPTEFAETSISSVKGIASEKAFQELESKIIRSASMFNNLEEVKKALWIKHAKKVSDSLNMSDLIGSGKLGINDIQAAYQKGNVLKKQVSEDLVARVKLQGSFPSKLNAEGKDIGYEKAVAKANKLTKAGSDFSTDAYVSKYNGRWYVEMDINTKKGWGTIFHDALKEKGSVKQESWRPFLSSIFTATSNPSDIQQLSVLRNLDGAALRANGDAATQSYKALSKEEKTTADALVNLSLNYQAWYTPEHLLERGVSPKVVDAYNNYRVMNDLDYFQLNAAERSWMQERGMKSIQFNGDNLPGYGREVKAASADALYKQSQTRKIIKDSISADDMMEGINIADFKRDYENGYKLIEVTHGPDATTKARQVYYWLNPDSVTINELPQFTMSYVAGGRRFFGRQNGFVKQIVLTTNDKTGRDVIAGLQTFATDPDFVGLTGRTKKLEEIRLAIARGKDADATKLISEAGLDTAPFSDAASFKEWAQEIGMDITHEQNALEVVKDGQPLLSYSRLASADDLVSIEDMYNLQHRSAFQAITNEQKTAKAKRTGRELYTYDFGKAQTVDFEHQVRYMVNDMVHNNTMNHFTDFYAERFDKAFRSVMNIPTSGQQPTAKEILLRGTIKPALQGEAGDLARAAETAQANYFAIRGVPSEFDQMVARNASAAMRAIGNAVQDFFHVSDPIAHGCRLKFAKFLESDPLGYMRAWTSHWYLGMFNLSQLYKQAASDIAVFSFEPQASLKAAKYVLPFSSALRKSDGNVMKAIEQLANKFGDAPKAVKTNFETMIRMGVFEHGVAGGMLEAGQSVKTKLNKWSMLPFNMGEMLNRTSAYLTAIYAKGFDGIAPTVEQMADIATYGQKLFMNMDSAGLSRLQAGTFGKTILQFQSYKMRWLETALFDKELTGKQRARLALINSLLVGTEGMLGMTVANGLYNVLKGDVSEEEPLFEDKSEVAKIIQRGFLNYGSEASGLNMDVAAPLSLELFDVVDTLTDLGRFEIPSTSAVGKTGQGVVRLLKTLNDSFFGEVSADDWSSTVQMMARQGELPPSVSKPLLGFLLYKTGMQFNGKGQLTEATNSALQSVLTAWGFNSLNYKDISKAYSEFAYAKNKEEALYKLAKPIYNELSRNQSEYLEKLLEIAIRDSELPPTIRSKVLTRLNKEAILDGTVPLLYRMGTKQLLGGGYEGNNVIMKLGEQ